MDFLISLLSPHTILFIIVILGFAIGKIRIRNISIGIAGVLFIAIIIGYLTYRFVPEDSVNGFPEIQDTMKTFSTLGSSLFVSVIGLQTGFSIKGKNDSSVIALAIGSIMSIAGVMTMLLISLLDKSITISSMLGILCGALTSTPGLSCVCELIGTDSEGAVLGYGCTYLFGVILVVFFAQLSSLNKKGEQSDESNTSYVNSKIYPELMLIFVSSLLGALLGETRIPFINISLGNTAGILFISLCMGIFVRHLKITVSEQVFKVLKFLGLSLFFAGKGFSTGSKFINLEIKAIIYGIIISLIAIICGLILCKILSNKYTMDSGFVIAGGMTSSPAYGAINKKNDLTSEKLFSFAYFGSLFSLLIAIQIILH